MDGDISRIRENVAMPDQYALRFGETTTWSLKTIHDGGSDTDPILGLIDDSTELRKTFKNPKSEYDLERNNWTKVEWSTMAYSMKNKRFTCDNISYHAQTGRVNSISFREL